MRRPVSVTWGVPPPGAPCIVHRGLALWPRAPYPQACRFRGHPGAVQAAEVPPMRRTLLLAMAAATFAPATGRGATEAEREAVAAVEKLGGKVKYERNDPARPVVEVDLLGAKDLTADK